RRHTRWPRDWSSDVCSSDLPAKPVTLQPAVIVNIQRQPGANIIGVVDEVQKILPQLQSSMPATVSLQVLTDRTNTIRASVKDVRSEERRVGKECKCGWGAYG